MGHRLSIGDICESVGAWFLRHQLASGMSIANRSCSVRSKLNTGQTSRTNAAELRLFTSLRLSKPVGHRVEKLFGIFRIESPRIFRRHFTVVNTVKDPNPPRHRFGVRKVTIQRREIQTAIRLSTIVTVQTVVLQERTDAGGIIVSVNTRPRKTENSASNENSHVDRHQGMSRFWRAGTGGARSPCRWGRYYRQRPRDAGR